MKKKSIVYAVIVPVVAAGVLGAGVASAHGWLWGATPQEIASQFETMFTKKASLLGMNAADFKAAWASGKTIPEIAKERGISNEELRNRMLEVKKAELKAQLQTLVERGVITQAQADERYKFMETRMGQGGMMRGGMMKRFGMHRGMF